MAEQGGLAQGRPTSACSGPPLCQLFVSQSLCNAASRPITQVGLGPRLALALVCVPSASVGAAWGLGWAAKGKGPPRLGLGCGSPRRGSDAMVSGRAAGSRAGQKVSEPDGCRKGPGKGRFVGGAQPQEMNEQGLPCPCPISAPFLCSFPAPCSGFPPRPISSGPLSFLTLHLSSQGSLRISGAMLGSRELCRG